jgi:hypothetical protein
VACVNQKSITIIIFTVIIIIIIIIIIIVIIIIINNITVATAYNSDRDKCKTSDGGEWGGFSLIDDNAWKDGKKGFDNYGSGFRIKVWVLKFSFRFAVCGLQFGILHLSVKQESLQGHGGGGPATVARAA